MATPKKTNAQRILEREKIIYKSYQYDATDGFIDGVSVAKKIDKLPEEVFKTLVARGSSKNILVLLIPVNKELDLKAAARVSGEKSIEMISVKEITLLTGYVKGGCSPIGMKKQFSTFIDESAKELLHIVVSAGAIGYQIELSPLDLSRITGALFAHLYSR